MKVYPEQPNPQAIDTEPLLSRIRSLYPSLPEVDYFICTPVIVDPVNIVRRISIKIKLVDGSSGTIFINADKLEQAKESDDFLYTIMACALLFDLQLGYNREQ